VINSVTILAATEDCLSHSEKNLAIFKMATYLSNRSYLRWDSPGVEDVPADEEADIQAVAEQIDKMQRQQFNNHRHVYTGTHCRTHGIVKGTFTVLDGLPEYLRQGEIFSKEGGKFPVACRYSTEPGDPGLDDRVPAPRGFSMKVFDGEGDFLDAGKDTPTQDFEFNNTPAIELANAKVTREIFDIRLKVGDDKDAMDRELEARDDTDLQKARFKVPNKHLATYRQYSQSAFRFGDYVFKFSIVPSAETQLLLGDKSVQPDRDGEDLLHKWLQIFHATHTAMYDFQVQLLENLKEQSVEYSGTEWDEGKFPWQTVAMLEIPPQEAFDLERKAFWEDHMRLDPWHGLGGYQPLGVSNRLRRGGS
jgi:hypothetical protein